MTTKYELMTIKPDHTDNLVRLYFYPNREAKFTVVTVASDYEYFEGSFFCLPDANDLIHKLVTKQVSQVTKV